MRQGNQRRLAGAVALVTVVALAGGCTETSPATDISETSAALHGSVNTGGNPTSYWFKYGETTAYGTETPRRDAASEPNVQNVAEPIGGLTPDTLYHFRICAENQSGSVCGKDFSFQTRGAGILPGFQENTAFGGLTQPTAVRFAPDGRVFIAEKSGLIKVFDGLGDATPTTFADLRTKVHNFWDRGLLGLTFDPAFPAKPFVYVAYTHDAAVGGQAPRWGQAGATSDGCPSPPGPTTDGCVVSSRISRLQAEGNQMAGPEQVLVESWCQQYPSHSIGDLRFGPDGALYASSGDGASFSWVDYGQEGAPPNPCGDPPTGIGGTQTPPSAEGGALRSQDIRTTADPAGLHGTIVRIDPDTGEALADNPLAGESDPNARRIIAHGLRNPFRFAFRPGTSELWIGDVGWGRWEEINRVLNPTDATLENFGWPCFEGYGRHPSYDAANLDICEGLYSSGGTKAPYYPYDHGANVVNGETCPTGSSSISGMAFNPPGSPLPTQFDGALFFSDYSRNCIWVMQRSGGVPHSSETRVLRAGATGPVDLQIGPGGDLFYASFSTGTIKRIHYSAGNQAPLAEATATPASGDVPLTVSFNGSGSSDPDPGDTLTFAWDLDGDGAFDDASTPNPTHSYSTTGTYSIRLKVIDNHGASATDTVAVTAGDTPPTAAISAPTPAFEWAVADPISFAGSASDPQDGALPASALSWTVTLHHCPSNCHGHALQSFPGTASGSFAAPDHEFPSYIELRLTATDSAGLTDTQAVRLDPKTVSLGFASSPGGLQLAVNGASSATPFSRTVIKGSANTISAPSPQQLGSLTYDFTSWSDGGAATHTVQAGAPATYRATYTQR